MVPAINHPIPADIAFKAWMLSMPLVTLDFETYYDDDYSLRKMTMTEYIQHPKFKAQSVSVRVDKVAAGQLLRGDVVYFRDVEDAMAYLRTFKRWVMVGQNTKFDGYICHYHYNVHPTVYADTKAMSKGLWPFAPANLADLAKRLWPHDHTMRKGDELALSKGVLDWSDELHGIIETYCKQDSFLTAEAFWAMFNQYPDEELEIIHITNRMFCHPVLTANHAMLDEAAQDELDERERITERALGMVQNLVEAKGLDYWNPDEKEAKKKKPLDTMVFSSRNRYIKLLRDICDLELPMKTKQRKDGSEYETEATAKNDPEYLDLVADNPDLDLIFEAREIFASNQAISRARRMKDVSKEDRGFEIPIALGYYNAHTGRYGGEEKMNMQNLGRGSKHRLALEAPDGLMVHVADSSNVEARTNAGFAGQEDLLQAFRTGADVYSLFASDVYERTITKKTDPNERNVGKVCVGAETLILTNNGVKPITYLSVDDKLWDGIEWVSHAGIICNGNQKTITAFGLEATPDHEILVDNSWVEWQQVLTSHSLMTQALDKVRLPWSSGLTNSTPEENPWDGRLSSNAIADGKEWLPEGIFPVGVQLDVISALSSRHQENDTSYTNPQWTKTNTESDCSTDFRRQSLDVTTPKTRCISTMDCGGSQSQMSGEVIEQSSLNMSRQSMDGINPISKWTEQMLIADISRAIFVLSRRSKTSETNEGLQTSNSEYVSWKESSPVYDVVNAGPRSRFTVITSRGPVIVHNCVLGLGYQMGATTLRRTFASGPMGMPPIKFPMEMCQKMVQTYRSNNFMIAESWKVAARMIEAMVVLKAGEELDWGPVKVMKERLLLPNGMYLNYPKLQYNEQLKSFAYWNGMYWKRIYGGALIENIIQALARIIVMGQCVKIDRLLQQYGGWIVMQVHDENIGVANDMGKELNDQLFETINNLMRESPSWMPELPLDSEGGWAKNYSK